MINKGVKLISMRKLLFLLAFIPLVSFGQIERTYYDNGQVKMVFDAKEGVMHQYNEEGQLLFKGNFKDGKIKDGIVYLYYDNGQLESESNMKDGKIRNSKTYSYYDSGKFKGKLQREASHNDGELDSIKNFRYYDNGDLSHFDVFFFNKDGEIYLIQKYDKKGNIIDSSNN